MKDFRYLTKPRCIVHWGARFSREERAATKLRSDMHCGTPLRFELKTRRRDSIECALRGLTKSFLSSGLVCLLATEGYAVPVETNCKARSASQNILLNQTASASVIKNLFGSNDSLREVTRRGLEKAFSAERLENVYPLCPTGCLPTADFSVSLISVPEQFLDDQESREECGPYALTTQETPIQFGPSHFPTLDAFESWFQDFSKGSNAAGKVLYEKCPGRCSPQYEIGVKNQKNALTATISVVCGLPRDKSDNNYRITVVKSRECVKEKSPGSS